MVLKAMTLRRPVAPTMTMMIIAGVRMVMAMGDKSGSNESGRWGCDSSWVFVVVLVSVVG